MLPCDSYGYTHANLSMCRKTDSLWPSSKMVKSLHTLLPEVSMRCLHILIQHFTEQNLRICHYWVVQDMFKGIIFNM